MLMWNHVSIILAEYEYDLFYAIKQIIFEVWLIIVSESIQICP